MVLTGRKMYKRYNEENHVIVRWHKVNSRFFKMTLDQFRAKYQTERVETYQVTLRFFKHCCNSFPAKMFNPRHSCQVSRRFRGQGTK